ncbi:hypothetical protein QBK99_09115 [Corticibacterium sp. UT-5YL-CI-8]|nr:hypothetical protein [Tianweitania sp. UT-5YL-CI-8]
MAWTSKSSLSKAYGKGGSQEPPFFVKRNKHLELNLLHGSASFTATRGCMSKITLSYLLAVPCLLMASCGNDNGRFEYKESAIKRDGSETIVNSLKSYSKICLIGREVLSANKLVKESGISGCPEIKDQGIVVYEKNVCSFYPISNITVMDDYDIECREGIQKIEIFKHARGNVLVFDSQ